jgi:uncharacterized protein (TIGR00255 family)
MSQLSGMTGFGRAEGAGGGWSWVVEARSVNGRSLEVRFRGPAGFDTLERLTREAAQARFQRGQVSVSVSARRLEAVTPVSINRDLAQTLLDLGEPWIQEGRVLRPTLDGLLSLRGVIEAGSAEADAEALAEMASLLAQAVTEALDGVKAARLEEGAQLRGVLLRLLNELEALVGRSRDLAGEQTEVIRGRFQRRLSELAGDGPDIAERAFLEAAALAVKADVREELDRLEGHLASARTLLAEGGAAGRRLEFLTQEFMREANTLCSKAAVADLTRTGLDLKATIDQFREQIQNVE